MPEGTTPDTGTAAPGAAGTTDAPAAPAGETAPAGDGSTPTPVSGDGSPATPAAAAPASAVPEPVVPEPVVPEPVVPEPVVPEPVVPEPAVPEPGPAAGEQTSLAAPAPVARGLSYAVDIVFCIDVTGSMTPILDAVKANALRFYDDVQTNLTAKGKKVDELRVRVIAFRDFEADGEAALEESPFLRLPDERGAFSDFVSGLLAEGGGDAPESGLEAVALAMNSDWTTRGDRRRQVVVVWTDQPAKQLDPAIVPAPLQARVPGDFSALTDLWEDTQGPLGSSSKRLILFAPDGPGWSDISAVWENVVHHPSQAGGGLSDVDYGTIVDSIGNSV
jgi:von Willebrand factor type A domain